MNNGCAVKFSHRSMTSLKEDTLTDYSFHELIQLQVDLFFYFLPAPAKISETIPSSSVTAYVGEELTLECFVEGDPAPTITLDHSRSPLGMK